MDLPHEMRVPGIGQSRYFESSLTSGGSMCAARCCSRGVRMIIWWYGTVQRSGVVAAESQSR